MNLYRHNTPIRLRIRFAYQGRPDDPPDVRIEIKAPRRQVRTISRGEPGLTREGPGRYCLELVGERAGVWSYAWLADGYAPVRGKFAIERPEDER